MSQPENHALNDFSSRFRHILGVRGWDRADIARLTPASWTTVQRWFEGSTPRGEGMIKLAAALGVNIAWLRDGIGPMLLAIREDVVPDVRLMEQGSRYGAAKGKPVSSVGALGTNELWELVEGLPHMIASATNDTVRQRLACDAEQAAHELRERTNR